MTVFDVAPPGAESGSEQDERSAESPLEYGLQAQSAEQLAEARGEYGSHAQYLERIATEVSARAEEVTEVVRKAFAAVIRLEELEVIEFQLLSVLDLGQAIEQHPLILKSLL